MPCRDSAWDDHEFHQEEKKKIDKLTRMLCELLTFYENEGKVYLTIEMKEWWEAHKRLDLQRIAHEERMKQQEKARDIKTITELKKKWNIA
jgi:hypothetical protein